jgi:hypothetical protein
MASHFVSDQSKTTDMAKKNKTNSQIEDTSIAVLQADPITTAVQVPAFGDVEVANTIVRWVELIRLADWVLGDQCLWETCSEGR